jgi:hypothetical protein
MYGCMADWCAFAHWMESDHLSCPIWLLDLFKLVSNYWQRQVTFANHYLRSMRLQVTFIGGPKLLFKWLTNTTFTCTQ